ncbi:MAG: hypothetical protein ACNS62_10225 [Candidatus Cyclobacteriaceae bacterium M3_2C_046]
MKAFIFSIILVVFITVGISCSDNQKEELKQEITATLERAVNEQQAFLRAQDSLKATVTSWKEEHEVFSEDSIELEEKHQALEEEHLELVDEHARLVQNFSQVIQQLEQLLDQSINDPAQVEEQLNQLRADISSSVTEHKDIMALNQELENQHELMLYGQRIDVH